MGLRLRPPAAASDPTGHELGESVGRSDRRKKTGAGSEVAGAGSEALNVK